MIIRSNIVCLLYSLGHDCLNFAFVEQRLESCFAFIKVSLLCLLPLYVSARSEIQKKVFSRLKKKKEICFSDNIPFQSNGESKHCFIIILRHKKCCWVGVLSFLMMHQLSFALERYFEQCPKEMVFFFGMPYLIGLS